MSGMDGRLCRHAFGLVCIALGALAAPEATAQESATGSPSERAWRQLAEGGAWGKLSLDARLRMELAEVEPADESQAFTLRTRLGYGTPVWRGFSAFAEGEAVVPFDESRYHDGVGSSRGESLIADPSVLQLNRLFAKFEDAETRTAIVGGRQRIKLDDDRFIGNVGWRQNEQTYDSATFATGLGVDGLDLFYGYVWDVRRIFGDKKTGPPGTKDFDVDAHLVNASYSFAPQLDVTLFTYFLDFEDFAAYPFSSNSYGGRLTGKHTFGGDLSVSYTLSYALQTDTGQNPQNYTAHYVLGDASFGYAPLAAIGAGYELLGSDDGRGSFITPLATLHAWNGWADAFLTNNQPNGLQDLFFYLAPRLPWGLKGKLVFHQFWSHEGATELASEYDAVLSKAVNEYLTILTKGAYFDGRPGLADRWRFWLEATFAF